MARIIVYLNDQFLREVPLTRETLTIGRKPDNGIHLDSHAVSGHHAQIVTLLNDSFLEDLDSTNGTVVNDHPVRKRALQEGDEIGIYHYRLVYTRKTGSVRPVAGDQTDKTVIIRMDAMGLPTADAGRKVEAAVREISRAADQPTPAASASPKADSPPKPRVDTPSPQAPARNARLHIVSGSNTGRILELVKPLTTLGRPGIQVAAIQRRGTGYMLIHVDGGASGDSPKVNDRHIGNTSRALQNGDIIDIAGIRMEFRR